MEAEDLLRERAEHDSLNDRIYRTGFGIRAAYDGGK